MRKTIVALLLCAAAGIAAGADGTARMDGAIRDKQGRPAAGVTVLVMETSPRTDQAPPEARFPITDEGGSFSAWKLPAGTYRVCVDSWQAKLLNPCEWGGAPVVTVAQGEIAGIGALELTRGRLVKVRIKDPEKMKDRMSGGDFNVFVRPVAWTPDRQPHFARPGTSGPGVHEFEILAPADTDLEVGIDASNAAVSDEQDRPVTAATRIPVKAGEGGAEPVVTFTMRPK